MPHTSPETFDVLRARIRDNFDQLSPQIQKIAYYALDQPNQFALQTIAVLAKTIGVQPSALIRFAKRFGYPGFSGIQSIFKQRLIEGEPDSRKAALDVGSSLETNNLGASLERCVKAQIESLEFMHKMVDLESLVVAIKLLSSARHIYIAGLRRSRPIATYLNYGLIRLERTCSLLDFAGGMSIQQVANMQREDLLVSIAFAPYSTPVIDATKDAYLRKIPLISITDNEASPLATHSDAYFCIDSKSTSQFHSIAGAIGLVQTLIENLTPDIH